MTCKESHSATTTTRTGRNWHAFSGARIRRAAALLCLIVAASAVFAQETIRLRGEDTMIYLAQQCSSLYRKEHGNTRLQFDIGGGGRNAGVTALVFGRADIAQVKSVLPSKLDSLGRRVVRLPIGIEFAVVYVHASNPVQELTMAELRGIFSGRITNWRQVGGHNAPIHLYAGESTTGLSDFFEHTVLQGTNPAPVWGKSSARELVDAVADDSSAIGYTVLHPRNGVRALRIRKAVNSAPAEPSQENLRSRAYPLTRFVYWYLPPAYKQEVLSFAEWLFSSHGQLVIESAGYMPLLPQDRNQSLMALANHMAR